MKTPLLSTTGAHPRARERLLYVLNRVMEA
jgi:hypothetical protein